MLITEILSRNARMYGNEIALIERDPSRNKRVTLTWKDFDDRANQLAQALIAQGVAPQDRVVQLMTNSIEWLPIYFGILRTGAIAVPLNFRFIATTIERCSALAEARVMIFGPEFIERIAEIKASLDRTVKSYLFVGPEELRPAFAQGYASFISNQSCQPPPIRLEITDDAALYFTSGTTGTPKGALLTHRNSGSSLHHRKPSPSSKPIRTISSAFRRSTIQAPKCTGSEILSSAPKP